MRIEFSETLNLPRARLFAYLADPRHRPEWQSSLDAVELLDDGEPRVGMRWRERPAPFAEFEMSITELVPGERWAERGHAAFGEVEVAVDFHDAGEVPGLATRLDLRIELRLRGPYKPFALGAKLLLPSAMRADLRRIERLDAHDALAA